MKFLCSHPVGAGRGDYIDVTPTGSGKVRLETIENRPVRRLSIVVLSRVDAKRLRDALTRWLRESKP